MRQRDEPDLTYDQVLSSLTIGNMQPEADTKFEPDPPV